mgnify:CR=1 FL=1
MSEASEEVEVAVGDKKLRIRGSDIVGLLNMLFIGVILYGGYEHLDAGKDTTAAIKEQSQATVQMVRALQEANCLNRLTPEQKKSAAEIEWCKKIGKGQAF